MKNHFGRRCSGVLVIIGWSTFQSWGQTELIQNGGFELGATSWTMGGGASPDSTPGFARSGASFEFLGGLNNEVDFCYQQITIPAGVTAANLSFYYNILSNDDPSFAYDTFSATIRNTGNSLLATVLNRSNVNTDSGIGPFFYHLQTFDLLPYAGQTIRVYFSSVNDSSLPTAFLIDDVSVGITPVPEPSVIALMLGGLILAAANTIKRVTGIFAQAAIARLNCAGVIFFHSHHIGSRAIQFPRLALFVIQRSQAGTSLRSTLDRCCIGPQVSNFAHEPAKPV
jgi:hypothetical protein